MNCKCRSWMYKLLLFRFGVWKNDFELFSFGLCRCCEMLIFICRVTLLTTGRIDFDYIENKECNIIAAVFSVCPCSCGLTCIKIFSVESQKGTITIQRCSVENQKGAIAIYNVLGDCALLVLNRTSLTIDSTLLNLN